MTTTTQVNCDSCGQDLSDSGPRPDYMLTLSASRIPTTSQVMFAVHVLPPIKEDHHFCGKACLLKWVTDEVKS